MANTRRGKKNTRSESLSPDSEPPSPDISLMNEQNSDFRNENNKEKMDETENSGKQSVNQSKGEEDSVDQSKDGKHTVNPVSSSSKVENIYKESDSQPKKKRKVINYAERKENNCNVYTCKVSSEIKTL